MSDRSFHVSGCLCSFLFLVKCLTVRTYGGCVLDTESFFILSYSKKVIIFALYIVVFCLRNLKPLPHVYCNQFQSIPCVKQLNLTLHRRFSRDLFFCSARRGLRAFYFCVLKIERARSRDCGSLVPILLLHFSGMALCPTRVDFVALQCKLKWICTELSDKSFYGLQQ